MKENKIMKKFTINDKNSIKEQSSQKFELSDFITNEEVYHIARVTFTAKNEISLHSHNYAEMLWIEDGEGIHHINGNDIPIKKNTLIMIRPDDRHNFTAVKGHMTLINVAFSLESLDYIRKRYFENSDFYFWSKNKNPFQIIIPEDLTIRLSAKAEEAMLYRRSYLQLDSLLLYIFKHISINETLENYSNSPFWLAQAIQNYNKEKLYKKGVSAFVTLCNRNQDYVNRVIKNNFGKTLTAFINDIRIKYAASQLLLTNIPIKLICSSCGFSSITYFYKQFEERYHMSPFRYRAIHQKII